MPTVCYCVDGKRPFYISHASSYILHVVSLKQGPSIRLRNLSLLTVLWHSSTQPDKGTFATLLESSRDDNILFYWKRCAWIKVCTFQTPPFHRDSGRTVWVVTAAGVWYRGVISARLMLQAESCDKRVIMVWCNLWLGCVGWSNWKGLAWFMEVLCLNPDMGRIASAKDLWKATLAGGSIIIFGEQQIVFFSKSMISIWAMSIHQSGIWPATLQPKFAGSMGRWMNFIQPRCSLDPATTSLQR